MKTTQEDKHIYQLLVEMDVHDQTLIQDSDGDYRTIGDFAAVGGFFSRETGCLYVGLLPFPLQNLSEKAGVDEHSVRAYKARLFYFDHGVIRTGDLPKEMGMYAHIKRHPLKHGQATEEPTEFDFCHQAFQQFANNAQLGAMFLLDYHRRVMCTFDDPPNQALN